MTSGQVVDRYRQDQNVVGLCRLLDNRDALIRRRAVVALGELRRSDAVDCLARAIHTDQDDYVRRWAVEALRKIGSPPAVEKLMGAMFGGQMRIAALAEQALSSLSSPQAQTALRVGRAIQHNDWATLETYGNDAQQALRVVLNSQEYETWPSARRARVLEAAVRLGMAPPEEHRDELAELGLFISGVHSVNDLFKGLEHHSAAVRIAAAEKLGASDLGWTTRKLYRYFNKERSAGGEREVIAAIARALEQLGDTRAIEQTRQQLAAGGQSATEAAYLLADIATPQALETLFWFAADPPQPPAFRNTPLALSALEHVGKDAVDTLRQYVDHEQPHVRNLLVQIISRSDHPQRISLLTRLARNGNEQVQQAAVQALASAGDAAAARALYRLRGYIPHQALVRALAGITAPAGPEYLRKLIPNATTLEGAIIGREGDPLVNAQVQVLQEHQQDIAGGWNWRAVSARAHSDDAGRFTMSVFDAHRRRRFQLKVVTPLQPNGTGAQTYQADLPLLLGAHNRIDARIDRFFDRLIVEVDSDM